MATRWQQLGAFVAESSKLTDDRLDHFSSAGGRWIVVVLAQLGYPDDHDPQCVRNLEAIADLKRRCGERSIAVGGWFNGWAGGVGPDAPPGGLGTTPAQDAQHVADIVKTHNLGPVVLDLEAAYKGKSCPLPELLDEVRARIKTREIGVSTNEPNDSMPWNGHSCFGNYASSMRRLNVKLLPQWYPWMGMWGSPKRTMAWLVEHGMEDNFYDPTYANKRAVALSYVHGTLEATGLEGSFLPPQLAELEYAQAHLSAPKGFSLYTLEDAPDEDIERLARVRGHLFLV